MPSSSGTMGQNAQKVLVAGFESADFDAKDVRVLGFRGKEAISQLFSFEIDIAMREGVQLPEAVGPGARLTLTLRVDGADEPPPRHIHGLVYSVRDRLDAATRHTYVIRLVPELTHARLIETQDVFLGLSVPEIIRAKLDLHELGSDDHLAIHVDDCPKRDFVVQYKESDLGFVCRLAEHLGISFLFQHGDKAPARVIFTDDVAGRGLKDAIAEMPYGGTGKHVGVFFLEVERSMFPSMFVVQDYNYRTPLADISGGHTLRSGAKDLGNGGGVVEYGTHHKDQPQGERLAKIRAEERLSAQEIYTGKSVLMGLTAGATPKLTGHPTLTDQQLLIVEVEHQATFAREGDGERASYENSFRAISAGIRYRPPRATPRPRIHGLVTGTVALGANGEVGGRAVIDGEGRYVVQFHFDTVHHAGEEKASHAIRMASPFAGPNHGMHFPLRLGAEVVIAFLDGDPDRPIIVGSVSNGIAPSASTAKNSYENRIQTPTGIIFQFSDRK